MKLYVYKIKGYSTDPKSVKMVECEVEERPKTYVLKGKIDDFYNSYVKKSEIGVVQPRYFHFLFMTEHNDQKMKEIYTEYFNDKIAEEMKIVDLYKEKLQAVEEF